jgi:hypothetical protein
MFLSRHDFLKSACGWKGPTTLPMLVELAIYRKMARDRGRDLHFGAIAAGALASKATTTEYAGARAARCEKKPSPRPLLAQLA